jgi:DeoR/GlpR family transcriptional regulator of sugar metabolism
VVSSINELMKRWAFSYDYSPGCQQAGGGRAVGQRIGRRRAVSRLAIEPSHLVKSTLNSEGETGTGALAAARIAKNSCIYLDAGTTPLALARAILDRDDLQVANDFEITQLLIDASQCGVIHTGGTLSGKTALASVSPRPDVTSSGD